jgi:hypothetical protein
MSALGILMLDTEFPRVPGDVGCAETFAFPVRYAGVAGATVDEVVHHHERLLLPQFVAAGQRLADEGCVGLATTCGFLARWQKELADALPVPVLASALLQAPLVERTLAAGRRVGIVTYSAASLAPEVLQAAGVNPYAPLEGVDPAGYFADAIRNGATSIDRARMADDVVAAARRLVSAHRDVGAIVLECANMPPYTAAVKAAVGIPVFDAAQLIGWFHAGVTGTPIRHAARNLW